MIRKMITTFINRTKYAKDGRVPFFELAYQYLPPSNDAIVVDIGCGDGEFATGANLAERYEKLYLLDANQATIAKLKKQFANAVHYEASQRLVFDDASVAYIHLSHLVEHLDSQKIYALLYELDRVLAPDGCVIISTPLLWDRFYDDLSHVRPYNPQVFINYLCVNSAERTSGAISQNYVVERLEYRYRALRIQDGGWTSRYMLVDVCIQIIKRIVAVLGFRYMKQNGYTLVLRKTSL